MTPDMSQLDLQREIQDRLHEIPPAGWVRDMLDHYRRTGRYRPEDLRRLLGDPNQAVDVGPNTSLASFFYSQSGSAR